ncbi:YbcC family protein [Roseovarius aquimarinus]|uniref:Probable inorganic carbon transporter subunit DabA n=1 Tax=Roseovarius aquimarinus TaxID=1229156 RepID=A0ABW7I2H8_9RHOB
MKADIYAGFSGPHLELIAVSETAARAIPPLWPLSATVAVNPYLGQTGKSLGEVSALMSRTAGARATMPPAWYAARIEDGTITDGDLAAALAVAPEGAPKDIASLKAAARAEEERAPALPTVAELAAEASGTDWPALIEERIGAWAAGYFDQGQALWQLTDGRGAFASWQIFASRDLTPEIAGLSGFAGDIARAPESARGALAFASDVLGLGADAAQTYFHQLLLGLGGWAQLARQRLWQAELGGEVDPITTDMLSIRLMWEQALLTRYKSAIAGKWADVRAAHAKPIAPSDAQLALATLQEAAERAAQRELAGRLGGDGTALAETRPALQAAFCIDVRSEVYRRALESVDPEIQTLGFAGFFGLTTAHHGFASDVREARLPVLLNNGVTSRTGGPEDAKADMAARLAARAARAWGRFKLAAVSSFAFVEATGPIYVGKLARDALGLHQQHGPDSLPPRLTTDMTLEGKVDAAEKILGAMSLTRNFAPLVLIAGHGASVVNNPHGSALQCGACGGYSGEVNARLLAGLLNTAEVRIGLAERGIDVPADTVFAGALHDTTTDEVTIFEQDSPLPRTALKKARSALRTAGTLARTERAQRLPRAKSGADVAARSRDWSETRPEWALAGCSAFIAAPRARTRGKDLKGRAFLHDYNWQADKGFGVLELILTAPVVVASWISLQYYGSVTAPHVFGAGNKLLHNVTGGVGVVEGNGGMLRGGLPWQSVHDGQALAHDPLRLAVCIEAPQEAITDILRRHDGVRALFDNRWLHLIVLDADGRPSARYAKNLEWEAF